MGLPNCSRSPAYRTAASSAAWAMPTQPAIAALRDMDAVLGVLPDGDPELEPDVEALLEARAAARSARDFAASDRLRDELAALGITVEDTRDGQRWRRTVEAGRG